MEANKDLQIKELELSIERDKAQLAAKKMLLKELSKEPSKPFAMTVVGMKLNAALAWCTKPFAEWHHEAHVAATDPYTYVVCKALEHADYTLKQAQAVPSREHKDARKMALKAAQTRMELSQYESAILFQTRVEALQAALGEQVVRLRQSPPSEQATKNAMELLKSLELSHGAQTS